MLEYTCCQQKGKMVAELQELNFFSNASAYIHTTPMDDLFFWLKWSFLPFIPYRISGQTNFIVLINYVRTIVNLGWTQLIPAQEMLPPCDMMHTGQSIVFSAHTMFFPYVKYRFVSSYFTLVWSRDDKTSISMDTIRFICQCFNN